MSLDALRRLRAEAVEVLVMELSRMTQTLARCEERHRTLEAKLLAERDQYTHDTQAGLTIEALLEWQGRLESHQAALRQVRFEIEHAAASWTDTNNLLVQASQEAKLLDRVLEQREATTRAEQARQEQRVMDEAASRRHWTR